MKKNTSQEQDRDRALSVLRQILRPDTEICTVLRHVSASKREVSLLVVDPRTRRILCLDALAAAACGWRLGRRNGIVVPGVGLDVGYWLVYNLERALGFEPDALEHRWI